MTDDPNRTDTTDRLIGLLRASIRASLRGDHRRAERLLDRYDALDTATRHRHQTPPPSTTS